MFVNVIMKKKDKNQRQKEDPTKILELAAFNKNEIDFYTGLRKVLKLVINVMRPFMMEIVLLVYQIKTVIVFIEKFLIKTQNIKENIFPQKIIRIIKKFITLNGKRREASLDFFNQQNNLKIRRPIRFWEVILLNMVQCRVTRICIII